MVALLITRSLIGQEDGLKATDYKHIHILIFTVLYHIKVLLIMIIMAMHVETMAHIPHVSEG